MAESSPTVFLDGVFLHSPVRGHSVCCHVLRAERGAVGPTRVICLFGSWVSADIPLEVGLPPGTGSRFSHVEHTVLGTGLRLFPAPCRLQACSI